MMSQVRKFIYVLMLAACATIPGWAQHTEPVAAANDLSLIVAGETQAPLKFSSAELKTFPRQTVTAKDHEGSLRKYEGFLLSHFVQKAGVQFGKGLKTDLYLLVEATDGYRAILALPEIDPAFTDDAIILADRRDNEPFPAAVGWQLIVPNDKRHARWVRQVKALRILRAPSTTN